MTSCYRPRVNSPSDVDVVSALQSVVGPARISERSDDLDTYARDLWPRYLLATAGRQPLPTRPQAVLWPSSAAEVQAVMRWCSQHGVPVVPFGAGSGVAGGAVGPSGSVVLDTKRLRGVQIDAERMTVTFEPGILGWHLEERLNRQGLSLGHFPSSIMCSTAGGWLATRGAGQMSTKYGKIEDMVRSLELVTGSGELLRLENGDRGGTDWLQLAVGSEGTLGVITSATCGVRRMPKSRQLRGFSFPSIEAACAGIQRVLQSGLRPAVVRLYDEIDTLLSGMSRHNKSKHEAPFSLGFGVAGIDFDEVLNLLRADARKLRGRVERWLVQRLLGETEPLSRIASHLLERFAAGSLMVLGFEGEPDIVTAEDAAARDLLGREGGRDLGEEPGQHWLRHRYDVSFKMSRAFRAGAFTDTIEVATTWDKLMPLYREVRNAVAPYALCMAHFSHAYSDGCSIYFTMIARRRAAFDLTDGENRVAVAEDQSQYDSLWRAAMQATLRIGATISHHHGVGRLKAPFMPGEHAGSLRILSALKSAFDPQHICNPGNLAEDAPPSTGNTATKKPAEAIRIEAQNLLVHAAAETPLYVLERALRDRGMTLGGLPPRALTRTLGAALAQPSPTEASLLGARLRDRRAQIVAVLPGGEELRVPPHVAPRRATGPDLGHAFFGQPAGGELGTVREATLRVHPHPLDPLWAGYLFDGAEAAAQALFTARTLHGAVALSEMVLCDRALLERILGGKLASESAEFALIVLPPGPQLVARATLKELEAQLKDSITGRLDAAQCRAFWSPDSLFAATATSEDVAAFAAQFPAHETSISLADSTAAGVASLLARAGQGRLVCGVYLHGLTLCSDSNLGSTPSAETPRTTQKKRGRRPPSAQTPVETPRADDDPQAVLWPRLTAAMAVR